MESLDTSEGSDIPDLHNAFDVCANQLRRGREGFRRTCHTNKRSIVLSEFVNERVDVRIPSTDFVIEASREE